MSKKINTDISSYSLSELLAITGIVELDSDEILLKTDELINRFKSNRPELSIFFKAVQSQLLQYIDDNDDDDNDDDDNNDDDYDDVDKIVVEPFEIMNDETDLKYPAGDKQVTNWYTNQSLKQDDANQNEKITDRNQKIDVFGNPHVPMKQEQLGVNDVYQIPVKQGSLNPNLKNTITRFVNLDSQFRQYTSGIDATSTNYTLDLSDTLKDVLSIRLYSFQIPYNWYVIDSNYGNTCFWISDGSYNIPISIASGNYTSSTFTSNLNDAFNSAFNTTGETPVTYNENNGKLTLELDGIECYDIDGSVLFEISTNTKIIFYDFTGVLQCNTNCNSRSNHFFNNTLGWLMGYRLPYVNVTEDGNEAAAVLDLNGTKYLILAIDDYNQNHVNNSLVSITQLSSKIKLPNYYSPDLPFTCVSPQQAGTNIEEIINELYATDTTSNGLLVAGKYSQTYNSTQILLPSAPRTLTQSQLYTINQINKNKNTNTNYLCTAPTSPDILGMLPIKTRNMNIGELMVEYSGSLQDNIRNYFGPVNIDRMCVKLLDDKGNIVNLNGTDWCVTLICECLYQY